MKLLTKEIEKRLAKYPLYSQDGKGKDAMCIARYFFPSGEWTWYILEGDPKKDTYFGIVLDAYGEPEYGYISLNELEKVNVHGLHVERDVFFKPELLRYINDPYLQSFMGILYGKNNDNEELPI